MQFNDPRLADLWREWNLNFRQRRYDDERREDVDTFYETRSDDSDQRRDDS